MLFRFSAAKRGLVNGESVCSVVLKKRVQGTYSWIVGGRRVSGARFALKVGHWKLQATRMTGWGTLLRKEIKITLKSHFMGLFVVEKQKYGRT